MVHEWTEGSYIYQVFDGGCRWRHIAEAPDAWSGDLFTHQFSRVLREMSRLADRVELLESLKPECVSETECSEIIGELASALAVLAGEDLKPCTAPRRGHLREKAAEAMRSALLAWRALQEGNRRAAARIAELEGRLASVDTLLASEEPPSGLGAAISATYNTPVAGNTLTGWNVIFITEAIWRWFREALGRETIESMAADATPPAATPNEPQAEPCDWPGCALPAICSSGNFGGLLVCSHHFGLTNGPWANGPSGEVVGLALALARHLRGGA
jgi:hypothetical protein